MIFSVVVPCVEFMYRRKLLSIWDLWEKLIQFTFYVKKNEDFAAVSSPGDISMMEVVIYKSTLIAS